MTSLVSGLGAAVMKMKKLKNRQRLDGDGEVEQQCIECLEWWPADEEFYYKNFARCKACYLGAKYAKRRSERKLATVGG